MYAKMVENNTFSAAKCQILAVFRKCYEWGIKRFIDLLTQPLFTHLTIYDTVRCLATKYQ